MRRICLKGMRRVLSCLVFAALCVTFALAAEVKVGTVNVDNLNLRASTSTNADILGQATEGSKVVVMERTGDWFRVVCNQTYGYMFADYLNISTSADFNIGPGRINASGVNFRRAPSLEAGVVTQFDKNKQLDVIGVEDGWYKVKADDTVGYVYPDYVTINNASSSDQSGSSDTAATDDKDALRAEVIAYAEQFLGCKYVYGTSNGRTFDCSGFTSYVYAHFGYSLNRSAAGQVSNGTKVSSRDDLKKGDLVLFRDPSVNSGAASHVGIYISNGKFIHCSSGGGCVKYSNLSDSYYNRYYIGGRRIIN